MDAILAALCTAQAPTQAQPISDVVGCTYAQACSALHMLLGEGKVERIEGDDDRVGYDLELSDGRVIRMQPNAGYVYWFATQSNVDELAALEAAWALPDANR